MFELYELGKGQLDFEAACFSHEEAQQ